jgi:hypothetical protein
MGMKTGLDTEWGVRSRNGTSFTDDYQVDHLPTLTAAEAESLANRLTRKAGIWSNRGYSIFHKTDQH